VRRLIYVILPPITFLPNRQEIDMDKVELNELLVGLGGIAVLAPPDGTCNPPNVQRVAVKDSSSHFVKFRV